MTTLGDNNYIKTVLKLGLGPKLVTFALSVICLPIMLKAVSISQYGTFVYLSSIVAIIEAFADMGVSSAAGKAVAECRGRGAETRFVVLRWAGFQSVISLLGLAPLLIAAAIFSAYNESVSRATGCFYLVLATAWLATGGNYCRVVLRALLAFRSTAILETVESLLRSLGYIVVAFICPTALGLAFAALVNTLLVSLLAFAILGIVNRSSNKMNQERNVDTAHELLPSKQKMLTESLAFLWLRSAVRIFNATPAIVFGTVLGSNAVGLLGSVSRIAELINVPFSVIGNALAVRSFEYIHRGVVAVKSLWDAALRILSLSFFGMALLSLNAGVITKKIAPEYVGSEYLLQILSFLVVSNAVSSVIAPMSDYVGALRRRNIILSCSAIVQVPVIWLSAKAGGTLGAVLGYTLILIGISCLYIAIALRQFFGGKAYKIPLETVYAIAVGVGALIISFSLARLFDERAPVFGIVVSYIFINTIFVSIVAVGIGSRRSTRAYYCLQNLFALQ